MKMKIARHTLMAMLAVTLSQIAVADGLTVKTGYDYSSGKYGTNTTTEITSIPFMLNYDTDVWTFKATLPYIHIKGANNVVSGIGAVGGAATGVRTESGMGDLTVAATRTLFMDTTSQTGFDLTGKIKFGIADSDKGLGTGENDYWVLADAYRKIGAVTYFGGVGYGVLGDSPDLKLKNVVSANLGASYKLNPSASLGAVFDTRTKSTETGDPQRELTAFYMHKLEGGYKLQAYAVKGFSDGSPDWGAGLNVGYNY